MRRRHSTCVKGIVLPIWIVKWVCNVIVVQVYTIRFLGVPVKGPKELNIASTPRPMLRRPPRRGPLTKTMKLRRPVPPCPRKFQQPTPPPSNQHHHPRQDRLRILRTRPRSPRQVDHLPVRRLPPQMDRACRPVTSPRKAPHIGRACCQRKHPL